MTSLIGSINASTSALNVFGTKMAVTSHNLANISTEDFAPQRAVNADVSGMRGVRLDAVLQARNELFGDQTKPVDAVSIGRSHLAEENGSTGKNFVPQGILPLSGTDFSREMTNASIASHAFEANTIALRMADEMLGTVLNTKA